MIYFLYGNYGTGKTAYIMDKIKCDVDNQRRAFWLVPEQKAVICERNLASYLPPRAQLYAEVLNFSRLCDKVFRLWGGLRYNYIGKSGKNLIMYRALCEVRELLTEYKMAKGKEKGCVALFLDAIGELKSYAISPAILCEACEKLESGRLKSRIHDLVCVFEAYERILNEKYSDPYDDIIMLSDKLSEHSLFEGASVYINSFNGFTGAQMRVLYYILCQAENVYISLDMLPENDGKIQFSKLSSTNSRLKGLCNRIHKKYESVIFDKDLLHKSKAISYLCDSIWSFDAEPLEDSDGITLLRPSDEFDECDTVASKIKSLIMQGARYSEIAVIVRNADTYSGIIDYSFEKYGIPYYMSKTTDIASKPLIKMLFCAINASESYSIRDVSSFVRSGYADISFEEADELENYIFRWGLYGKRFKDDSFWSANPDGYITEPTENQMQRLGQINDTRAKIIKYLSPLSLAFQRKLSVKEICLEIYRFLESLNVRERLQREIEQAPKDEAIELSQLYSAIISSLDTMVEIIADETLDQEAFLSTLSYVLDGVKVGSIPTGEDNVTIGEAGALRTEQIKYAFVLGVTEGSFPANISSTPFFSDADKIELEGLGISLSAKSDERADDELLNFKNSIAIASEELFISSPRSDIRGARKEPSVAYKRIQALFPSLRETVISTQDKLFSEKIAIEFSRGDSDTSLAVREIFDIDECDFDFSNETQSISREGARAIFGDRIYLSQSKIEKFVNCPFQYYCSYLLNLSESEKIEFGSREVGVLAHSVFEHFLRRVRDEKIDLTQMTDAQIAEDVSGITAEYLNSLFPNGTPTNKLKHIFDRLESNIIIYIRALAEEFAQSKFSPEFFELAFSKRNGGLPPLEFDIGDGATITLSGVVDRVDIYRDGDTAYVRVVDYKTGEKKFSFEEFEHGLELQLFIYLFTLCKKSDGELGKRLLGGASRLVPAGVLYFPMQLGRGKVDKEIDLSSPDCETAERESALSLIKRSGVFLDDERVILAQDAENTGTYIPKKTARSEKYFFDEKGFDWLYERLKEKLFKTGSELLSGNARAQAIKFKNHKSACEWCQHKAICRRRVIK